MSPRHPAFRASLRWWIVEQSALRLLAISFSLLAVMATLATLGETLTVHARTSLGSRISNVHLLLDEWLIALRAVIGVDVLPAQQDNFPNEAISSATALVGGFVPALALAVILVRLYSVRPFIWRTKAAICLARECDFIQYASAHADSDNAMLTVRFYNKMYNLAIVDLCCRVYLRHLIPSVDGTLVFHKILLKQLNGNGQVAEERLWPSLEFGAPFTVWIPLDCPITKLPMDEIQGNDIIGLYGARILVRLTAKAVGIGTEVVDEKWYNLTGDIELGRFVPVEPVEGMHVKYWSGWEDFENTRAISPKLPINNQRPKRRTKSPTTRRKK